MKSSRIPLVLTAGVTALLAACASSVPLNRTSSVPVGLMRGTGVLVVCEYPDPSTRAICEDQLAEEVGVRGARPLKFASSDGTPSGAEREARWLQSARDSGAAAILVLSIRPVAVDEGGTSLSLGFGGFGRSVGGGVGVAAPLGGGRVGTGFDGRGRVVEVATGRTVWTAGAIAPPSDDLPSQLGGLSLNLLDGADRAGLF